MGGKYARVVIKAASLLFVLYLSIGTMLLATEPTKNIPLIGAANLDMSVLDSRRVNAPASSPVFTITIRLAITVDHRHGVQIFRNQTPLRPS
jgi:hypothetical protein